MAPSLVAASLAASLATRWLLHEMPHGDRSDRQPDHGHISFAEIKTVDRLGAKTTAGRRISAGWNSKQETDLFSSLSTSSD